MEHTYPLETDILLPRRHRWSRTEFYKIVEAGCFSSNARLELIDGDIFEQELPMKSLHATGVYLCDVVLKGVFREGYVVRVQLPITLSEFNELLLDIAVCEGSPYDFVDEHPTSAVLIVEVADSTLKEDRTTKASLYARYGILEYWVLNLTESVLEVHREPDAKGYATLTRLGFGETVYPMALPNVAVSVSDLLPNRERKMEL